MTGIGPQPLGNFFTGDTAARARQADALRQALSPLWQTVAGEALARHSGPLRWDKGVLVIQVDSSLWAAKLRHQYPEILNRMRKIPEFSQITEFRICVVPTTGISRSRPDSVLRLHISAESCALIEDVASGIRDEELRQALLRLSDKASRRL